MDVSFVNPFIISTLSTFKTMLGMELSTGKPMLLKDAKHTYHISGVIGLSGEAQGIIALSFPKALGLSIVSKLIGEDLKIVGPELTDGIGELTNIVAGYAKQNLTKYKLSISLPNVVIGSEHKIAVQTGIPTIIVPMEHPDGNFAMEVSLKTK